jgi:hypothetical protein
MSGNTAFDDRVATVVEQSTKTLGAALAALERLQAGRAA